MRFRRVMTVGTRPPRWLVALAGASLLALASPALSQDLPPPGRPKPRSTPRPEASGRTATASAATAVFVLSCDVPCRISLDRKPVATLDGAGKDKTVTVPLGEHRVSAVTQDGQLTWEQIVEAKGGGQRILSIPLLTEGVPADPLAFERAALEAWLALSDVKVAGLHVAAALTREWGFQDPTLTSVAYSAHEGFKREVERLKRFAPAASVARQVQLDFASRANAVAQYVDLLTKAVTTAQQNNARYGPAADLLGRAKALELQLELPATSLGYLNGSALVKEVVPPDRRARLGLPRDARDFDLGAHSIQPQPQTLLALEKGGLADRLGLEPGDRVISAAGKPVGSVWEMKLALRENAGRTVKLAFERKGKRQDKEVRVPASLPP